ncbi:MAG: hypothetical protein DI535_07500 [Citrobacter freundii]|nr:MAG: hypothetical protein DI535_07500 [Citrobacter freundii]
MKHQEFFFFHCWQIFTKLVFCLGWLKGLGKQERKFERFDTYEKFQRFQEFQRFQRFFET